METLLRKLRFIHEGLGGDQSDVLLSGQQKSDKFHQLRLYLEPKIYEASKALDERDKLKALHPAYWPRSTSHEAIATKYKAKALIQDVHTTIEELKSVGKFESVDLEAKVIKLTVYERQYEELKVREDEGNPFSPPRAYELSAQKSTLMRVDEHDLTHKTDLSDFDIQAQKRWQSEMQYQDEVAERIANNAQELKSRAANIHDVSLTQALQGQEDKIDGLEGVVDTANKEMETSTRRLKRVMEKIRTGDKCCMTLVLLLILIGLATVGVNMLTSN